MKNWIRSKLNELLLLSRKKKKAFFVIILLAVLLVGAIIKVEYYHKDFLIKELLINQYFNNVISSNFVRVYSVLCKAGEEALEEKDYNEFFETLWENCIALLILFSPYTFATRFYMVIEEQKVPFLKKHKVYLVYSSVRAPPMLLYGSYILVINTSNLKKYWLDVNGTSYLPIQKAIENFNKIITTEKININSYEDCVELIKTLVKLIDGCGFYYNHLILKEEDEFIYEVSSLESTGKVYKKYRVKSLFIFEPEDEDCYYVELHMGQRGTRGCRPLLFKKCTFKVKKNGVVYDFNEINFFYYPRAFCFLDGRWKMKNCKKLFASVTNLFKR